MPQIKEAPLGEWSGRIRSTRIGSWFPAVVAAAAAAGTVIVVALAYGVFADRPILEADLSTYLLPGRGLLDGSGSLYVDYFDIKPPWTYAPLVPWLWLVGSGLLGWWVLYAALLFIMFAAQWLLLRTVLSPWLSLWLFASMAIVMVGAAVLEELFFITEVMGLVLILVGLRVALLATPTWIFIGALVITLAGQVKEVFILAPLALVPLIFHDPRQRWKNLLAVIAGGISAALIVIFTLIAWGSGVFAAYLEVLQFKGSRFPPPTAGELSQSVGEYIAEILAWLPLLLVFLIAALVIAIILRRSGASNQGNQESSRVTRWSFVLLFVGIALGFIWQGAPLIRHYAVAVIPPLFLMLAAVLAWIWPKARSLPGVWAVIAPAVLLIGTAPALSYFLWAGGAITGYSPSRLIAAASNLESSEHLEVFDRIARATSEQDCMQVAYGWSASAYYWYAEREPCARFIVPPLDLSPELRTEYQNALIANPPSLLVVDTAFVAETTVDEVEGTPDEVIFPFQQVAQQCYQPLDGNDILFVPTSEDPSATSRCIADQVRAMRDRA